MLGSVTVSGTFVPLLLFDQPPNVVALTAGAAAPVVFDPLHEAVKKFVPLVNAFTVYVTAGLAELRVPTNPVMLNVM